MLCSGFGIRPRFKPQLCGLTSWVSLSKYLNASEPQFPHKVETVNSISFKGLGEDPHEIGTENTQQAEGLPPKQCPGLFVKSVDLTQKHTVLRKTGSLKKAGKENEKTIRCFIPLLNSHHYHQPPGRLSGLAPRI